MTSNAAESRCILGTFRVADGVGVVRIEDRLEAPIDEVWSALTDPSRLAQWYGEIEGDLRLGGEFHSRLHASGWEGTRRITACDPPHGFTLGSGDDVSEVTLTADGGQTVIVYENRSVPVDLLFAYGAGEQIHVEDLGAHLAAREREPADARWDALEAAYRPLAEQIAPQR